MKPDLDLSKILDENRGVEAVRKMAALAIADRQVLDELLYHLESDFKRRSLNASWVLTHVSDAAPDALDLKDQIRIFRILQNSPFSSIRRNLIRIWQFRPVPESLLPDLADLALSFLGKQSEEIAVRAFSLTVLENCLKVLPGLENEVLFILERQLSLASPAFSNRAKRFIRAAEKLPR